MSESHLSDASPPTDAALVARCQQGDASAWEALVHRYQRLVYAIVRRMGLDEHAAADVFQTVFVRLMENLSRLTDHDRLQAWIVTTAKREALLQRKRGMRAVSMTPASDDDHPPTEWDIADDSPLPEDALAALQVQHQVRSALDRLDERCRALLSMLYINGEDSDDEKIAYDDVAARLGMPVGSIGPTRARCLGKLRKLVA
jgi:RNA polymerase sigma factor (sigma-70 family)